MVTPVLRACPAGVPGYLVGLVFSCWFGFQLTSGSTVSQHVLVSLGLGLVQVLRLLSTPQGYSEFRVSRASPWRSPGVSQGTCGFS